MINKIETKIVSSNDLMQWKHCIKNTRSEWILNTLLLLKRNKIIQYFSFFKRYDLYELKVIDYWYFWILHWEIAKWHDEDHNRTKYQLALESKLLLIKSICLALLLPFCSVVQCWDVRIHSVIRCFEQPLPRKNIISLNVSVSPMGFFQNDCWMSCGQVDNG